MKTKSSPPAWFLFVLLALAAGACRFFTPPPAPPPLPEVEQVIPATLPPQMEPVLPTPPPATPPILNLPVLLDPQALRNAVYRLPDIAYYHEIFPEIEADGSFRLQDGVLELESADDPMLRLYLFLGEPVASGDLNGDGADDAVVVLGYNSGGTGTFYHLAAVLNRDGLPEAAGAYFIGDRVIIQQVLVRDGLVVGSLIIHGPEDGACCPTQPSSLALLFKGGRLVDAIADQVAGPAESAILALQAQDMSALAALVHPDLRLRFSPYAFVHDGDLVFQAGQIPALMTDPTVYEWGMFDGSGEPIRLAFWEYYQRFIYTRDFANAPQISYNQRLGYSSMIDNSRQFYPVAVIVEYHFPGQDPQYGGLDWRSLRLVFVQEGERWYLIGIINDEWTT